MATTDVPASIVMAQIPLPGINSSPTAPGRPSSQSVMGGVDQPEPYSPFTPEAM
jgi:hypothetical protein